MTTVAIVQARMTSTRLPGKVLAPLAGEPMILRQLDRLSRASRIDAIVVATSTDPSDDALTAVLMDSGYRVHRGSLDDVLARFIGAAEEANADVVVRITADCPLLSPTVVDQVIEQFEESGADYASNTLDPTYPDGLDVEVIRATALRTLQGTDLDTDEHEHVTLGIYRRPHMFRLHSVIDPTADRSNLRWTVDTPEDLGFVTWVYESLFDVKPQFEYEDVLRLLAQHPQRSRSDADGIRNAALIGKDTGAMKGTIA